MPNLILENELLTPIFEQIKSIVDFTHVLILYVEEQNVNLVGYRGPMPLDQASLINFDLYNSAFLQLVYSSRAAVLLADTCADTPQAQAHRKEIDGVPDKPFDYVQSLMAFPLRIGEQYSLLVEVAHSERGYYSTEDVSALREYFEGVGTIIENYALSTILTRRYAQSQALLAIQQAIFSHLEFSEVLQVVADQACRLTSAQNITIFLLEGEQLSALCKSGKISSGFQPGNKLLLADTIIGETIRSRRSMRMVSQPNRQYANLDEASLFGSQTYLIVPLIAPECAVGALVAIGKVYANFGPDDEETLKILATGAATAIENAMLHRQVQNMVVMEERERIGRELHDNIAQSLSILKLKASHIGDLLNLGQIDSAQSSLNEMRQSLTDANADVREAIVNLRNTPSSSQELMSAIQTIVRRYRTSYGIDASIEAADASQIFLTPDVVIQVIRIIQEALVNIRKHAQASKAWVRLEQQDSWVTVTIEDNGIGFNDREIIEKGCGGVGLQIMHERAESVGGDLQIISNPGSGTRVIVRFPTDNQ
jgi:nitrate/nitrite-specific signal transduction histidine kinase